MLERVCGAFRVSNQHTFGVIFDRDLTAPTARARHVALIVEAVFAYLRLPPRVQAQSRSPGETPP